jgi:hypothetical protein
MAAEPDAVLKEVRALLLRKCERYKAKAVAEIFARSPFGELERLVTQKLVEVAKEIAATELENDAWLRAVTQNTGREFRQLRVLVLEFLETSPLQVTLENFVWFLDPLIDSWDVDLVTLDLMITMNASLGGGGTRHFGFLEHQPKRANEGFREFLKDKSLSATASAEELGLLKKITFTNRRPTALFYYRELQNLRDPLHFKH